MHPTIFRVIREIVDGKTVRILLEPYSDFQTVDLKDGSEFITGNLMIDHKELFG